LEASATSLEREKEREKKAFYVYKRKKKKCPRSRGKRVKMKAASGPGSVKKRGEKLSSQPTKGGIKSGRPQDVPALPLSGKGEKRKGTLVTLEGGETQCLYCEQVDRFLEIVRRKKGKEACR